MISDLNFRNKCLMRLAQLCPVNCPPFKTKEEVLTFLSFINDITSEQLVDGCKEWIQERSPHFPAISELRKICTGQDDEESALSKVTDNIVGYFQRQQPLSNMANDIIISLGGLKAFDICRMDSPQIYQNVKSIIRYSPLLRDPAKRTKERLDAPVSSNPTQMYPALVSSCNEPVNDAGRKSAFSPRTVMTRKRPDGTTEIVFDDNNKMRFVDEKQDNEAIDKYCDEEEDTETEWTEIIPAFGACYQLPCHPRPLGAIGKKSGKPYAPTSRQLKQWNRKPYMEEVLAVKEKVFFLLKKIPGGTSAVKAAKTALKLEPLVCIPRCKRMAKLASRQGYLLIPLAFVKEKPLPHTNDRQIPNEDTQDILNRKIASSGDP